MKRLFAKDGKCFDLAIDHGFFNQYEFLSGIEDMEATVRTAVEVGPDAVQVAPGQAHLLQNVPGRLKPSLVLRVDTGNIYEPVAPGHLFAQLIGHPVEQAVRWDAVCVVLNLYYMPDRPEMYHASVSNVCAVKAACERYGMAMMVEPLVMLAGCRGGYDSDGDPKRIIPLVRQAAELGADVIKCEPTTDSADFHRVVQAAGGRPVLARGGGRTGEDAILQRTWELMQEGAAGIVYGRNVFQHANPAGMTRAFLAIVHDGANAALAAEALRAAV
jgi:DhnA family fructose-bisphosphate aldolase class Ia